ncbi:hypothetical protein [Persephonella sp.]|nr:hypothetical protein [Aquificota bacterium]
MKTLSTGSLLKQYRIDVECIDIDDTFELEDMFHTRKEIVKRLDSLSLDEVKEFLKIEKELGKYIPEIKKRYGKFYDKKVEPVNRELKRKLSSLKEYLNYTLNLK